MTVVGYEPLVPTVYLNLAGSQWGNTYRDETILVLNQGGQLGELLMSGQSAACIQNDNHSWMARAVVMGFDYATIGATENSRTH